VTADPPAAPRSRCLPARAGADQVGPLPLALLAGLLLLAAQAGQAHVELAHVGHPLAVQRVLPSQLAQQRPVVLTEPAPDAVLLADLQRVSGALLADRAALAELLRRGLAQAPADPAQVVVRVEELRSAALPATALQLPVPHIADRLQPPCRPCHRRYLLIVVSPRKPVVVGHRGLMTHHDPARPGEAAA